MNTHKLLLAIGLLLTIVSESPGQALMKTYYDWTKSKVKEEYYTNSKGEKHGAYKAFDENGNQRRRFIPPSMPRMISRPAVEATVRIICLAKVSNIDWRPEARGAST